MIETVIIDRNKPDDDPAVFVGEWCFSVVGLVEDENIPEGKTAVSVYGNTNCVDLMIWMPTDEPTTIHYLIFYLWG